jgi:hypothetical protein
VEKFCGERDRDMARKKTGKRGSAIIVLMVVAAIAGSPSTAAAANAKSQPLVSVAAPAPVQAFEAPLSGSDYASWAEASWAGE